MSSENFEEMLEKSLEQTVMRTDQAITAEVIGKTGAYAIVNAGLKSEAEIPLAEFRNERGEIEVDVGDRIEVIIVSVEDGSGRTRLSREKACLARTWEKLEKSFEEQSLVTGCVTGKVRGGFTVMINNIRAFLPGSLIDTRALGSQDGSELEGKEMEFKLIKLDRTRNNLVVSRRAVVENEPDIDRQQLLDSIQEDQVIKGVVKNLTEYGAFVNLGGVDGLLHVTDMAWRRVRHPSEVLNVGDEVEVLVLKFDREKNRISLGLKQMGEDPWLTIEQNYPKGVRLSGKVTNITEYGAFVELEGGVEGLVHISEMSWSIKNANPSKILSSGEDVEVVVLGIDSARHRISLGMKQCQPNPWEEFAALHAKGTKVSGAIKSITDFGIFIGLPNNIDGLIHLSDLSWDTPGEEMLRRFKKGEEITAVVLAVDAARERISLGFKQATEDPFTAYISQNEKGTVVQGVVKSVEAKCAILQLEDGVQGLLRVADISDEHVDDASHVLSRDQKVEAKITKIDRKARRIMLSMRELHAEREEQAVQEYSQQAGPEAVTLGDRFKGFLGKKKSKVAEDDSDSDVEDS